MRIDGTNRLDYPGPSEGSVPRPTRSAGSGDANSAERFLGDPSCKAYIEKASASQEVDLQKVAEAKKLIESGQLDTPEAVTRVVERIISMGI